MFLTLEDHYRDMCDIEFTIEQGKLWMLQTRVGKRTATAALRIAIEMVEEGLITREEAVSRIDPAQLDQLPFTRSSTPPKVRGSPAVLMPAPVPPWARSCSRATMPSRVPKRVTRSFWFVGRPTPTT